jgi:hypothetical protein
MILIIYIKNHYSDWPKGMQLKDSAWKEMQSKKNAAAKRNTLQRPNQKTFRFKFELLTVKHFNLIVINVS